MGYRKASASSVRFFDKQAIAITTVNRPMGYGRNRTQSVAFWRAPGGERLWS